MSKVNLIIEPLRLGDDECALFGYGSLLSIRSLERTLGRCYTGPLFVCWLEEWRRSWDVAMPNSDFYADLPSGRIYPEHILYLNIHRSPSSRVNGVLFVVNREELANYDSREWIYDRVDVTSELSGVTIASGRAHTYVAKEEHLMMSVTSPQYAAVRATYLEILENGLEDLGEDFRAKFEASTDPVPKHLIIPDRHESTPPQHM